MVELSTWDRGCFPGSSAGKESTCNAGVKTWKLVAKLCPTFCISMDCSLSCSSVRGILQARVLEWVGISFSKGSSQPRDQTWVSYIAGTFFTNWATRECRRPWFNSWVGKIHWRRDRPPTPVFLGFPRGSDSKESACSMGDLGLVPGSGRSPGEGNGGLPTPVFLPGEFHGQRGLTGCSLWAAFTFTLLTP